MATNAVKISAADATVTRPPRLPGAEKEMVAVGEVSDGVTGGGLTEGQVLVVVGLLVVAVVVVVVVVVCVVVVLVVVVVVVVVAAVVVVHGGHDFSIGQCSNCFQGSEPSRVILTCPQCCLQSGSEVRFHKVSQIFSHSLASLHWPVVTGAG